MERDIPPATGHYELYVKTSDDYSLIVASLNVAQGGNIIEPIRLTPRIWWNNNRPEYYSLVNLETTKSISYVDLVKQLADDFVDQGGMHIIVGSPGIGKTTLAMAVASEISHKQRQVTVLASEPLAETMKNTGLSENIRIVENARVNTLCGLIDDLEKVNNNKPAVLIIDSLDALETNNQQSDMWIMERLVLVAKKKGVMVLAVIQDAAGINLTFEDFEVDYKPHGNQYFARCDVNLAHTVISILTGDSEGMGNEPSTGWPAANWRVLYYLKDIASIIQLWEQEQPVLCIKNANQREVNVVRVYTNTSIGRHKKILDWIVQVPFGTIIRPSETALPLIREELMGRYVLYKILPALNELIYYYFGNDSMKFSNENIDWNSINRIFENKIHNEKEMERRKQYNLQYNPEADIIFEVYIEALIEWVVLKQVEKMKFQGKWNADWKKVNVKEIINLIPGLPVMSKILLKWPEFLRTGGLNKNVIA